MKFEEGRNLMYIKSQDGDTIFSLTDKGLLKGQIYISEVYIDDRYWATNVFGRNLLRTYLLGTFDTTEDAENIVREIYKLLRMGVSFYTVPQPLDTDDLDALADFDNSMEDD
jgi:hypothetical protein